MPNVRNSICYVLGYSLRFMQVSLLVAQGKYLLAQVLAYVLVVRGRIPPCMLVEIDAATGGFSFNRACSERDL